MLSVLLRHLYCVEGWKISFSFVINGYMAIVKMYLAGQHVGVNGACARLLRCAVVSAFQVGIRH